MELISPKKKVQIYHEVKSSFFSKKDSTEGIGSLCFMNMKFYKVSKIALNPEFSFNLVAHFLLTE